MTALNPLYDPATDNLPIDEAMQKRLNQPLVGAQLTPEEEAFLHHILALVQQHVIHLHTPSSLFNREVYDALPPEEQGLADHRAVNLLSRVREIVDLAQASLTPSYQLQHVLAHALQIKKQFEARHDLFLI